MLDFIGNHVELGNFTNSIESFLLISVICAGILFVIPSIKTKMVVIFYLMGVVVFQFGYLITLSQVCLNFNYKSEYIKIEPSMNLKYTIFVKNSNSPQKQIGDLTFNSTNEYNEIGYVVCKKTVKECVNTIKSYEKDIALNKSLETVVVKN